MVLLPRGATWRQLFWEGGEDVPAGALLAAGAFLCFFYSAVQLLINGPVYDEAVVPAQILAGAVRYPAGHPHDIFYRQAFSLPQFIHGWLWGLCGDPLIHSAERNLWFLFLSLFAPYAMTVALTRRPMWGYLAAAVTATETMLQFKGTYPQWVFPGFYSNGHVGLQLAVIVPALLLARCWRLAGFLAGLLPAIHAAMAIVVWPWAALYALLAAGRPLRRERVRLFAFAAAGMAMTAGFAGYVFFTAREVPMAAPYIMDADAYSIHRVFTQWTDTHRRLFPLMTLGYLGTPAALGVFGALAWWLSVRAVNAPIRLMKRESLFWALFFGAMTMGMVWLCGVYQWMFDGLPWYVERAMPNRFSNIVALLLLPVTAAVLATIYDGIEAHRRSRLLLLLAGVLLFAAGLRVLEGRGIPFLYSGRVENNLIYIFWGAALGAVVFLCDAAGGKRWVLYAPGAALVAVLALLYGETRGVLYLVAGFAGAVGFLRLTELRETSRTVTGERGQVLLAVACLLLAAAVLPGKQLDPWDRSKFRWDVLSPYDVSLREWLSRHAQPEEMILPALFPRTEIQPKTGNPVLMELETLYIMTYMPRLSGVIGTMAKELYGLDYTDPDYVRRAAEKGRGRVRPEPAWQEPWARRTRAEWQALARKYNFRYVLSYYETPLDLPVVFPGAQWNLYMVPQ